MRLGLVVYGSLDRTSGGYRYDRRLVSGLRNRGHEVEIVGLPDGSYGRELLVNGSPRAVGELSFLNVDVLLQDELCHPSLLLYNRLDRSETPVVSVVHHLLSQEPRSPWRNAAFRAVERRYLETVDAFVYNSETTRRTVESLVGATKGVVAPPAADHIDPEITPAEIRERAHEPGPIGVLFVGTIVERKGLHTLLRGLSARPVDEWRLTVVGDRTADRAYVQRIDALTRKLDVAESVEFAGQVSDTELIAAFRSNHLLAVPSRYEGFGIVYLEGMSFGLPAIASKAGGASEIVTDEENGVLIPPETPAAVSTAIETVAADRDRLAEMGKAARATYESHPTWSETVDRVERFLADVSDATDRPEN